MQKTKNDLPEKTRQEIIPVLQARLADSVDMIQQAKQAHWNVKGPSFIALHELFDKVSESAEEWADLVAERIVQLGGTAEGTIRMAAKKTSLPEYPAQAVSGREHVEALSTALATYGKAVRHAIDASTELRDADTADVFTEISRDSDKYLWFVEAHLQSDK